MSTTDGIPAIALDDETDWLEGLERAGLPIRRTQAASAAVSPGLAQLVDEANAAASPGLRDLVANSIAPGTRAAYEKDWADFEMWCRINDHGDPLDAPALSVGEYLNELVRDRKAVSTIERRLAAIAFCQQLATGRTVTRDPLIAAARAGAKRLLGGRGKTQATPLRLDEMRTIVTGLPVVAPNRPTMRRDQLIIALGWASALRASALTGLDVDDLTVVGDPAVGDGGLVLKIRGDKGRPDAGYVAIPFSQQWSTCPVRRTIQYVRSLGPGAVFRHIDRHGHTRSRLSARAVSDVVRRCVVDCLRIDPAGYTSHSLRAGFVTEARAHDVDDQLIARHTRHAIAGNRRGSILNVYDRPTDLFRRHALAPDWW